MRRRLLGRGPTLLVLKLISTLLLKSTNPQYAAMVHRGPAGIPPALRAGSYRYKSKRDQVTAGWGMESRCWSPREQYSHYADNT